MVATVNRLRALPDPDARTVAGLHRQLPRMAPLIVVMLWRIMSM